MTKLQANVDQLFLAIKSLETALKEPFSEFVRDAAIQRFEYTVDLAWKTIKNFLEENKGVICHSPKECIRLAYQQGLIDYDEEWLNVIDMRNQTSHLYLEGLAQEIYSKLPGILPLFSSLLQNLQK